MSKPIKSSDPKTCKALICVPEKRHSPSRLMLFGKQTVGGGSVILADSRERLAGKRTNSSAESANVGRRHARQTLHADWSHFVRFPRGVLIFYVTRGVGGRMKIDFKIKLGSRPIQKYRNTGSINSLFCIRGTCSHIYVRNPLTPI